MAGSLVLSKFPPQSRGPSHQLVLTTGPLLLDLVHFRIKHSTVLPWQLPFLSLPPPPPPFSYPALPRPLPDFPPFFKTQRPILKNKLFLVSILTKENNNTILTLLEAMVLFLVMSNLKKQVHMYVTRVSANLKKPHAKLCPFKWIWSNSEQCLHLKE